MKKNIFVALFFKYIYYFVFYMLISYGLSIVIVKGAGFISDAVDCMLNGEAVDIENLVLTTMLLVVISMILAFVKKICGESFSICIQRESKNITVKNLITTEYRYFEKNSGAIITRLISDIDQVGMLFSEIIPEVIQSIVLVVTLMISVLLMDLRLFTGIVVSYPIVIIVSNFIAKRVNQLAKLRRGKYDSLTECAQDIIGGIEIERSYRLFETLYNRIERISDDILYNEILRNKYQAFANAAQSFIKWMPCVICSVIALIEVFNDTITVGELMMFIILFNKLSAPMSELPFRINDGREMLVSLNRINQLVNEPKEKSGDFYGDGIDNVKNIIEMKDIEYRYGLNQEKKVLEHLNVSFEKGKITAIVGESGTGKTTLFKILCGLINPTGGKFELCGVEFEKWNIGAARRKIGFVSQNAFLFPDTIAANVANGYENITMEQIVEACKKAHIHDDIMLFTDGYQTIVGERGANLSGGQVQRLSIARALLKNAPILLLDEPTSALDMETERNIMKELRENPSDKKTIIMIAHRLSTIVNADKIIVMDKGKVAEQGTHQSLLEEDGIYARLYKYEMNEGC